MKYGQNTSRWRKSWQSGGGASGVGGAVLVKRIPPGQVTVDEISVEMTVKLLTCDREPAGWRLSMTADGAPVEAFIRPGNRVEGHVTCRLSPDEGAIFIESSWEVGGRGL